MRTFLLLAACVSTALAVLQMDDVGYLKLMDCDVGNTNMFTDAAIHGSLDATSNILYVHGSKCVHVVLVEDLTQPIRLKTEYFEDGSDGRVVDVEVCGNTLAVLLQNPYELTEGHVYFCDLYSPITNTINCDHYNRVTVGESPTSMKFTSNCDKLVVANAGRAGLFNGVFVDPDGTVSIVTKSLAVTGAPCTTELSFVYFNARVNEYLAKGVRWSYRGDHNNGIVTLFSQSLEPDSIAISDDNTMAYVTLPGSNAMGVISLANDTWMDLYSVGTKNWHSPTLSMDASDRDAGANLVSNYEVKSLYQPTSAVYVSAFSSSYVVTANQGHQTTYTTAVHGVDFTDSTRAQAALFDSLIDQAVVSEGLGLDLSSNARLGRVHMSRIDGRNVFSNLIDDIHIFGGRDVGFWNARTHTFDSTTDDDLEKYSLAAYPDVFNGDCSNDSLSPSQEMDQRSDDMGPEPNVVAVGEFNTVPWIAAATRNGLIYLYSFSINTPIYQSVHRLGNMTIPWKDSQASPPNAGDGLISDMGYIAPTGASNPHLFVISRGTGSLSIKQIANV